VNRAQFCTNTALRVVACIGLSIVPHFTASASAQSRADSPATFKVRIHNLADLPDTETSLGRHTAQVIFGQAGLAVDWLNCGPTKDTTDSTKPCLEKLLPNEVILRIMTAPRTFRDQYVLGASIIRTGSSSGQVSTVFADQIAFVARENRIPLSTLLGRTIAHEVGHLLLGTAGHGREGLMRSRWSPAAIRRNFAREWTFSSGEVARMRQAVLSRVNASRDLVVAEQFAHRQPNADDF
jgi:hypothetical protein